MKRVLRIGLIEAQATGAHAAGQGVGMPLGLMTLAAVAREQLPGEVAFELADAYFLSQDEIQAWLRRWKPDGVALSGLSVSAESLRELAGLVTRLTDGRVPILVGGPHATHYPEACLGYPGVCAVVRGEGEIPFVDYLEYLLGRRALRDVRGIVRPGPGGPIVHPAAQRIDDLDAIPMPAYDLVDVDLRELAPNTLATIMLAPHRHVALHTSRGCPFRCTFCHNLFGRKFRAQSVRRVVDEMEQLSERYRTRHFQFYDDIFNADARRLMDFCLEIRRRRLDARIYFINGLRADSLDRTQLEAMADAGVVYFGAAIETASPHGQALIEKELDVARLLDNVAHADELGIFTTGFMMLGIPGETREDMEVTIRTAETSRLSYVYFSVTNPYEGTPLGQQLARQGVDVSASRMVGYSSPGRNFAGIPEDAFRALLRSAYRRFWTPARMVRFLARHPAPEALWLALGNARVRTNLVRRVRAVLGVPAGRPGDPSWVAPARPGPMATAAARFAGRLTQGIARLVPLGDGAGEPLHPSLRGRVAAGARGRRGATPEGDGETT